MGRGFNLSEGERVYVFVLSGEGPPGFPVFVREFLLPGLDGPGEGFLGLFLAFGVGLFGLGVAFAVGFA